MGYRVLADATMAVHLGFLAYVVAGGFLAWRWPRAILPHLLLAGWGGSAIAFHLNCPLTFLEDWARRRAGEQGLPGGFIDHYLVGVIYPQRYAGLVEVLAILAVALAWTGALVRWRRRPRRGRYDGDCRGPARSVSHRPGGPAYRRTSAGPGRRPD
jgi:Protein of Unknown function (DUF2784)